MKANGINTKKFTSKQLNLKENKNKEKFWT
jgi:hypothetical protein